MCWGCHADRMHIAYSVGMDQFSRTFNFAGASNFRDLGGYLGHGGRAVRWRHIFRSDHLATLTEQDALALADLGVTRSLDFRGQDERAAQAYDLPNVRYHALSIEPTGTRFSTSATVTLPAVAIIGLKFRAVFR